MGVDRGAGVTRSLRRGIMSAGASSGPDPVEYEITATQDAHIQVSGSGYTYTATYVDLREGTGGAARVGQFQFQVPEDTSTDVTAAALDWVSAFACTGSTLTLTVASDVTGAIFTRDLRTDYSNGVSGNGTVAWEFPSAAAGGTGSSPDFASVLASALQNSTPSGGYRWVAVCIQSSSGSGSAWPASVENATYDAAVLRFTA